MCLMALMGAVLSALLKANSIQNRPLAREVDGSWLSMGVQSEGLLEGSPPFPSVDGGVTGRLIPSWHKEGLNYPARLDHGIGAHGRSRHPVVGSVPLKLSSFLLFTTKK